MGGTNLDLLGRWWMVGLNNLKNKWKRSLKIKMAQSW